MKLVICEEPKGSGVEAARQVLEGCSFKSSATSMMSRPRASTAGGKTRWRRYSAACARVKEARLANGLSGGQSPPAQARTEGKNDNGYE